MNKISYEDRVKTYGEAVIVNGVEYQLHVALEELAECQKEICKALRGDIRKANLAEEVADALIVLEQVQRIFRIEECVENYMDSKVKRLKERTDQKLADLAKQS